MSGALTLNEAQAERLNAAAAAYAAEAKAIAGQLDLPTPNDAVMYAASVAVQGVIRALADPEDGDQNQALFAGGGEGMGMMVGLVPDAMSRMAAFQLVVQAMHGGTAHTSRIHDSQGEA